LLPVAEEAGPPQGKVLICQEQSGASESTEQAMSSDLGSREQQHMRNVPSKRGEAPGVGQFSGATAHDTETIEGEGKNDTRE
jgi:hypothetical protein